MSSDFKIIDKGGEWFVNTALFRMVDPTNDPQTIFEAAMPTKVKPTDWMKGQPMIVACPDPINSDEPMPATIVPVDSVVVPKDEITGEPDPVAAGITVVKPKK